MDCTVHGILQAWILEWLAFPFSRGSSRTKNGTSVSCIASGFFTNWAIKVAWNAVLVCNLKNDRMILVHFQRKPFNITVIQIYAPTTNAEWAKVDQFYEDLEDFLEQAHRHTHTHMHTHTHTHTHTQRCSIHHRGLECKSRKSRDTWSLRQIWPWIIKWSRTETNRILPREHTNHSKHTFSTALEMTLNMDLIKLSVLNQIDYILCSWRWRNHIQ